MDDLKFNSEDDDTFQFGTNNDDTNDELNIKSHSNKGKLKIKKSKQKLNKPQKYEQPVKQNYNTFPMFAWAHKRSKKSKNRCWCKRTS